MESAPNKRSYVRLAAMGCLLRGMSRREVCEVFCRGDRGALLWILKYNAGGIDALLSKPTGSRRRKVSLQRIGDILVPVLKDPRRPPWSTGPESRCMAGSRSNCKSI